MKERLQTKISKLQEPDEMKQARQPILRSTVLLGLTKGRDAMVISSGTSAHNITQNFIVGGVEAFILTYNFFRVSGFTGIVGSHFLSHASLTHY